MSFGCLPLIESRMGISPLRSPETVRESLPSYSNALFFPKSFSHFCSRAFKLFLKPDKKKSKPPFYL